MWMPDRISQYSMIPQMARGPRPRVKRAVRIWDERIAQAGIGEPVPGRKTSQAHEDKGVAGRWQGARRLLRNKDVGCLQGMGVECRQPEGDEIGMAASERNIRPSGRVARE